MERETHCTNCGKEGMAIKGISTTPGLSSVVSLSHCPSCGVSRGKRTTNAETAQEIYRKGQRKKEHNRKRNAWVRAYLSPTQRDKLKKLCIGPALRVIGEKERARQQTLFRNKMNSRAWSNKVLTFPENLPKCIEEIQAYCREKLPYYAERLIPITQDPNVKL